MRGRVVGRILGRGGSAMRRALRRRHHVDRLLFEIARAFRAGQDQCGGAVVLHAAVVKMKRLDDPSRAVVLLAGQRAAVHHGARVELRVMVVGEHHRGERVLGDAMLVHEASHAQCDPLRGNEQPVGPRVRGGAGDGVDRGRLAEAAELALRERAEHHHVFGIAGRHRCRRLRHGARTAAPAAAPYHARPRVVRKAQRGRQARRVVAIVAVGGEAVEVGDFNPGVLDRLQDRFAGELEFADRRLPALVVFGLAEAGYGDLVLDAVLAHRRFYGFAAGACSRWSASRPSKCGSTSSAIRRIDLNHGSGSSA